MTKIINKRLQATKEKTLYAAVVNTDLTEGRGHQYVMAFAENKATAERLGAGKNVQGSNATIQKVKAYFLPRVGYKSLGTWYIPQGYVHKPTKEDLEKEVKDKEEAAKQMLLEKFKKGEEISDKEREELYNLIK